MKGWSRALLSPYGWVRALRLLALESPLIAVLWQEAMARATMQDPRPAARLLLFLVTWIAYAGDRWLDARVPGEMPSERGRYRISRAHPAVVFFLGLIAAAAAFTIAVQSFDRATRDFGFLAFGVLAVYLLAARMWPRVLRGLIPRELMVGVAFAVACTTLVGRPRHLFEWWILCGPFALLLMADAMAISHGDRGGDGKAEEWNGLRFYRVTAGGLRLLWLAVLGMAGVALWFGSVDSRCVSYSVLIAATIFLMLTRKTQHGRSVGWAADLALLLAPLWTLFV